MAFRPLCAKANYRNNSLSSILLTSWENAMARRALIVIDVQNDYAGGELPIEFPDVQNSLRNIGAVMDAAHAASIPVVVVQNILPSSAPFMAEGTSGVELHEIVALRPQDHFVAKKLPSAFAGTDLEGWLREHAIDTITVIGYMTHNCNLSTMLHAFHSGFAVEFISDASGSVPYENRAGRATAEEIHRVMSVVLQSRFAAVMLSAEWVEMLQHNSVPERDSIFLSNRRARGLAVPV
jgi:nicotinamidase-related amidase